MANLKRAKDVIAVLSGIVTIVSFVIGHVIPSAWLQGITAWRFLFVFSLVILLFWGIDRYIQSQIISPITKATEALLKLEQAAKMQVTENGQLRNTTVQLAGKIDANYEYIRKCLVELREQIPASKPPSVSGTSKGRSSKDS